MTERGYFAGKKTPEELNQAPPSEHDQLAWFVAYLDEHGDPRTLRAELAELRAEVRDFADSLIACETIPAMTIGEQLRKMVGPWPHEKAAGSEEA